MSRSIRSLPPVHPPPSFPAPASPTSPTSPERLSVRSLGSAHRLASRMSVDSGYSSEYHPSPQGTSFDPPAAELAALRTAYQHWRTAHEAQRTVATVEEDISRCEAQLKEAGERLSQLEKESQRPNTSGGLRKLFGKKGDKQHTGLDLVNQVFTDTLETARNNKTRLEQELSGLKLRLESLKVIAEKLDADYDALKKQLEEISIAPWFADAGGPHIAQCQEKAAKSDHVYDRSHAETQIWGHAERAVQHAHFWYTTKLKTLGAVLNRGGLERMFSDEHGTEITYQEAVEYAKKAQACFEEFVGLIAQHPDVLSEPPPAFTELREVGLLQAVTLYNLHYGGKPLQFGVKQEKKVIDEKTHAVYERLTTLAVWVQEYAKGSRTFTAQMRSRRDEDRARLVDAWARCIPSGIQ